ncbi:hypothetical protein Bca52824_073435 [Brassica carinata]|uniref:Uncharacterized protein n=1 Tax=Brassica carinata TaxID=52824 RepID=A0A8X7U6P6_BRACI|nr:hypothetical protein Bca52824_073435 [Brassica carinata]
MLTPNIRDHLHAEEAAGLHKRVKGIHDPVRIVVPCAVVEVESPIPPDRIMQLSPYIGILDDPLHAKLLERVAFRDEIDKDPAVLNSFAPRAGHRLLVPNGGLRSPLEALRVRPGTTPSSEKEKFQ